MRDGSRSLLPLFLGSGAYLFPRGLPDFDPYRVWSNFEFIATARDTTGVPRTVTLTSSCFATQFDRQE
jgi:hypothetical protein